jgi:hypothetical protein
MSIFATVIRRDHGRLLSAEAKEVVGGYPVYNLKSKREAIDLTKRFMELRRKHWPGWEGESEIREIMDPSGFAPPAGKQWRIFFAERVDFVVPRST